MPRHIWITFAGSVDVCWSSVYLAGGVAQHLMPRGNLPQRKHAPHEAFRATQAYLIPVASTLVICLSASIETLVAPFTTTTLVRRLA